MKRWFLSYSYKSPETPGFSCYCCRIIDADTIHQACEILRHTEPTSEFQHLIIRSAQ